MSQKRDHSGVQEPTRRYRGANIPMSANRRYARAVAAKFQPDKIILFGSCAYGTLHDDSDVDLLVVMPARNQLDQAYRIRRAVRAPFPMDLVVRTPAKMRRRLAEGESFLTEVVSRGKVLHEKDDRPMGAESRS
jgi:predicted nucleotidyltransferase